MGVATDEARESTTTVGGGTSSRRPSRVTRNRTGLTWEPGFGVRPTTATPRDGGTDRKLRVIAPSAATSGRADTAIRSPGAPTTTSAPVAGSVRDTGAAGSGSVLADRRTIRSGDAPGGPVNHAVTAGRDGLPPAATSAHRPPGTSPAKTTRREPVVPGAPAQGASRTARTKSSSPAREPPIGPP